MRARKRYYHVLGVSRDAPPAEVKRAYRALAKRLHPDRLGDPEAAHRAEERLKEINAAWNEYCALARAGAEREAGPEPKRGHTRRGAPPPDDEEAYWAARKAERERASGWQRRPGRATRDRYRAERARTFRDREERERRDRERVAEVRRERARQVHERVTRDHERLRGIVLLLAGAALMLAAAFVILLVVVFVSG